MHKKIGEVPPRLKSILAENVNTWFTEDAAQDSTVIKLNMNDIAANPVKYALRYLMVYNGQKSIDLAPRLKNLSIPTAIRSPRRSPISTAIAPYDPEQFAIVPSLPLATLPPQQARQRIQDELQHESTILKQRITHLYMQLQRVGVNENFGTAVPGDKVTKEEDQAYSDS